MSRGSGKHLHLGAGGGEGGLKSISALKAAEGFVVETFNLGVGEADFVFHGFSLCGGGDGIELGAEAGGFLAVAGDLTLEPGAERVFVAERGRGFGGFALGGGEFGGGLGDLSGQGAQGLGDAGALQIYLLQLYEMFNMRLHPWIEVYGIGHGLRKWGGFAGAKRLAGLFPDVLHRTGFRRKPLRQ